MRTRRYMHGRRRTKRSPAKIKGEFFEKMFGDHPFFKKQKEGQEEATAKNTMSAQGEASGAVEKVGIDKDKQHDETHTHPPAAFENENKEGTQGAMNSDTNSERAKAQGMGKLALMKGKSGGWGSKVFGF